jgi:hypothetical protein
MILENVVLELVPRYLDRKYVVKGVPQPADILLPLVKIVDLGFGIAQRL